MRARMVGQDMSSLSVPQVSQSQMRKVMWWHVILLPVVVEAQV